MCTKCSPTLKIHAFALQVILGLYLECLRLFSWSPMYLFICIPQCCITCPILWPAHPSLLQAGSGLYVRAPGHATHTHTHTLPTTHEYIFHYLAPALCPAPCSVIFPVSHRCLLMSHGFRKKNVVYRNTHTDLQTPNREISSQGLEWSYYFFTTTEL